MEKSFMRVKVKNSLLIVFVSVLFLSACATHVSAQPATVVAVNPPTVTINEVGGTGTINITVTDVTDLYAWQTRLYFDNETLALQSIDNETAAWLPDEHIFSYTSMYFFTVSPQPGDPDWEAGYVEVAGTLIGDEPKFNGSGTLCQINFTGIALGSSPLTFGPRPTTTFLVTYEDSEPIDIPFEVSGGEITVIPEFPTFTIIALFIILTLVTVMIAKKWSNKRYASHNPPVKTG